MKHLLLALPLLLAACVQPAPPVQPEPDPDLCRASSYQGLVGQPRSVLSTMLLPAGSRVIGPNDAVTADFSPERLNIEIDQGGRIAKIACY
jgi:hypothetical protein